jgi:uncharacterized protein (TIGR02145 family)
MKNAIRNSGIILIILSGFACKKKDTVAISPSLTTNKVSAILYTTAMSGGTVTNEGGSSVTYKGVCWGTDTIPTIDNNRTLDGSGADSFTSSISGLTSGTSYHVRAYAINSEGTSYGNEVVFTTKTPKVTFNSSLTYGTLTDIDGNIYKTIPIGTQEWMAENLRTTKFNDGTAISLVTVSTQWIDSFTPAYCWFDDSETLYGKMYGATYNWFAVSSGNLCPAGWHVPADSEWQTLVSYLGSSTAGSKIKEAGSDNWLYSNSDATNISGFTALPAGQRASSDGAFTGQGYYGGWWSSTEVLSSPLSGAYCRYVRGDTAVVIRDNLFKIGGFSVRCLKD